MRWLNRAARELVGDRVGVRFTEMVAPESVPTTQQQFARKLVGGVASTEYEASLLTPDGKYVRAEISSVPIESDDEIVGVFGFVAVEDEPRPPVSAPELTPRQAQVLQLLARGCSTEQMADELGLARETVRNHVRAVLRALGVHSRLEAVIEAHRRGIV